MKAITPHYIDGKFVEPHGLEVIRAWRSMECWTIRGRLGEDSSSRAKAANLDLRNRGFSLAASYS